MRIQITYEDNTVWIEDIDCDDFNEICWENNRYYWDKNIVHDDKMIKEIIQY